MTTLVAVQRDGWVVLGCDSRTSDEDGRHMVTNNPKIVNNNGVLIAAAGASRGANILQFGYAVPKPKPGQNLDNFMTRVFVPRMRAEFKKAGYDMKEDGEAAGQDSCFFVAVNGTVYPIWQDYSWDTDVRGVYTMGSGGDIALGSLDTMGIDDTTDHSEVEFMVGHAIEKSIKNDIYCSAPVHLFTQRKSKPTKSKKLSV